MSERPFQRVPPKRTTKDIDTVYVQHSFNELPLSETPKIEEEAKPKNIIPFPKNPKPEEDASSKTEEEPYSPWREIGYK